MMIHISYRLPVKKWRVTSQEDKALVAARKQEVHDRFKAELGLKVDEPIKKQYFDDVIQF